MALKRPQFTVFKAADGYRWRLQARNGEIIATSESYTTRDSAWKATRTVKLTAPLAKRTGG